MHMVFGSDGGRLRMRFAGEPCQWDQYLGNPGRTGYMECSAMESPDILWEATIDGEATTLPSLEIRWPS